MQKPFDLTPPEQGILDQVLADLEVKTTEELVAMKAEGDRIIAEALANKTTLAILHRRIGNREKLETFMHHAHAIREIPAVRRNVMQTKISEDFMGELELRIADSRPTEVEAAFRSGVAALTPFFNEITATEEDGCSILRATAELFELVAYTESFDEKA